MPSSMYKILIHGTAITENALLPISQLSEEAQKSRNEDLKKFQGKNTRMCSRKHTMTDLLHAVLISSDRVISSKTPVAQKKSNMVSFQIL